MTETALATRKSLPELPTGVWVGWIDEFRRWVEPTTDAASEGIFAVASLHVALAIGRLVSIHYGRPMQANLFELLIGGTGVPRKSTILSRGRDVLKSAFTDDFVRVAGSIGSGEGLLEVFCNESIDAKTKRVSLEPVPNQRVLLEEPEFCNLLKKAKRLGTANIVEILLSLFDGDDLSPRTRAKPIRVMTPYFCLVSSTTPENLETTLADVDIESGLIPRFASFYCTPKEPMAYPPRPDPLTLSRLGKGLQDIRNHAASVAMHNSIIALSPGAVKQWEQTYADLTHAMHQEQGGAAAIMVRVPAMVMKWALIYAMQAGHAEITEEDLAQATLVGTYLAETASLIPGRVQKSQSARVEAKILETLRRMPDQWLSANSIHRMVSGRIKADELRRSLDSLCKLGVIQEAASPNGRKGYRINEGSR